MSTVAVLPIGAVSSPPTVITKIPITGGLQGFTGATLLAVFNYNRSSLEIEAFDTNNFNTEEDALYTWRVEDLKEGSQVTVSRVRLKYRNIGRCTFTVGLQGMYTGVSQVVTVGQGTVNGQLRRVPATDNRLYLAYIDLTLTDESPQLSILRKANNGPLSIISVDLLGNVHQPIKGV
jgi:hypothetical protein